MLRSGSKKCANRVDENHVKRKVVDVGASEIVRLLSNCECLTKSSPPLSSGTLGCRRYQMDTAHV